MPPGHDPLRQPQQQIPGRQARGKQTIQNPFVDNVSMFKHEVNGKKVNRALWGNPAGHPDTVDGFPYGTEDDEEDD